MNRNRLFDLAFEFKRAKLWKKLFDSHLFAVKHSDGSIGYCSVMGNLGEYLALAVYPGDEGLSSFRHLYEDHSDKDAFELHEMQMSQNCVAVSYVNKDDLRPRDLAQAREYCAANDITLRGKHAYPQFERFRPYHYPWYLDDEIGQTHLAEALSAALEVSKRLRNAAPESLGLFEGLPYDREIPLIEEQGEGFSWGKIRLPGPIPLHHPSPELTDDIALSKLRKGKKRGMEWACDLFMFLTPVSDEESELSDNCVPENAPFFPFFLLIVECSTGILLNAEALIPIEGFEESFLESVLKTAQQHGVPSRIRVPNERAHALFSKLAPQMGAKLELDTHIPVLDDAKEALFERFDEDDDDLGEEEMEFILEVLQNPELLSKIPDDMLIQLQSIESMGVFPDDVVKDMRKECARRGID